MRPHNLPHTYMCYEQGSHPQFCDVATLAIYLQKELAKFGYIKVGNFKKNPIAWRPAETHCLNMANSDLLSSKYGDMNAFFFPKKSYVPCRPGLYFCRSSLRRVPPGHL